MTEQRRVKQAESYAAETDRLAGCAGVEGEFTAAIRQAEAAKQYLD